MFLKRYTMKFSHGVAVAPKVVFNCETFHLQSGSKAKNKRLGDFPHRGEPRCIIHDAKFSRVRDTVFEGFTLKIISGTSQTKACRVPIYVCMCVCVYILYIVVQK